MKSAIRSIDYGFPCGQVLRNQTRLIVEGGHFQQPFQNAVNCVCRHVRPLTFPCVWVRFSFELCVQRHFCPSPTSMGKISREACHINCLYTSLLLHILCSVGELTIRSEIYRSTPGR
jgi:hypothetical protein